MGAIHSTKISDRLDREKWSISKKGGPVFFFFWTEISWNFGWMDRAQYITFHLRDDNGKLWVEVIIVTSLDAVETVDVAGTEHRSGHRWKVQDTGALLIYNGD